MQIVLQGLQLTDANYMLPSKMYWEEFLANHHPFILSA